MMEEGSVINGETVTNAEWVIFVYFGEYVYSRIKADPENFYLVLEPCATSQVAFGKKMVDDTIFCASTFGWVSTKLSLLNQNPYSRIESLQ